MRERDREKIKRTEKREGERKKTKKKRKRDRLALGQKKDRFQKIGLCFWEGFAPGRFHLSKFCCGKHALDLVPLCTMLTHISCNFAEATSLRFKA